LIKLAKLSYGAAFIFILNRGAFTMKPIKILLLFTVVGFFALSCKKDQKKTAEATKVKTTEEKKDNTPKLDTAKTPGQAPGAAKEEKKPAFPSVGPVAKVNGKTVKAEDVLEIFKIMSKGVPPQVLKMHSENLKKRILTKTIESMILLEEADKRKISVNEDEINSEFEDLKKDEKFAATLKQSGRSPEEFRKEIKKSLVFQKLFANELSVDLKVKDDEVAKFYSENKKRFEVPKRAKASHILIKVDEKADPKAKAASKKKIEGILATLNKGEDFAKLAKENSQCPSSARGGQLGEFLPGQMVPAFEKAAFELEPGKVSGVVKTRFGFHIIKLHEKHEAGQLGLNEVKLRIKKQLVSKKLDPQKVQTFVSGLKQKAKVEFLY